MLFDFFATGVYDRRREFILTNSPSMDILISSNLERLIYLSAGCDAQANRELMRELSERGSYQVTESMRAFMSDFKGGYASQEESGAVIRHIFEDCGYLIDTHTGVAAAAYEKYRRETGDETVTVIASTASPYKFAPSVMAAIQGPEAVKGRDEFDVVEALSALSGVPVPQAVEEIRTAPIRHSRECRPGEMENLVKSVLGV